MGWGKPESKVFEVTCTALGRAYARSRLSKSVRGAKVVCVSKAAV